MTVNKYTVFMADNTGRVGEIEYSRLWFGNRYLAKGRWELSTNYIPAPITWKSRVEIVRKGVIVFSGPFTELERNWTYAETDQRRYAGTCDNIFLDRAFVSPDPSLSTGPYTTQVADVRGPGAAETIIRQYVNYNIGPLAVASRKNALLTLATDQARGSQVKGRARFEPLMEFCLPLAFTGGVGFEIVGMQFRFYVPSDKSGSIIFSEDLDNLSKYEYKASAPQYNYVVVGGSGTGTSRTFYELGDGTSITNVGRREMFIDARNTTDTAELAQKAIEALTEKADGEVSIHVVPGAQAIEAMSPYDNYYLGDYVTVVVDGAPIVAQVQELGGLVTMDEAYEHVTLGNYGKAFGRLNTYDLIKALSSRITRLEVV